MRTGPEGSTLVNDRHVTLVHFDSLIKKKFRVVTKRKKFTIGDFSIRL